MILSTFAIYQAQEHSWKQLCMAQPGMPKCENVNLSFLFSLGLTQHCLDLLSHDSTAFRSVHVYGTVVLLVSEVYFFEVFGTYYNQ